MSEYETDRVDQALDRAAQIPPGEEGLTDLEFFQLALACLDQAGYNAERVRTMLTKPKPYLRVTVEQVDHGFNAVAEISRPMREESIRSIGAFSPQQAVARSINALTPKTSIGERLIRVKDLHVLLENYTNAS